MRWDESHESDDVIDERGRRRGPDSNLAGLIFWLLPDLLRTRWGRVLLLGIVGVALYQAYAPAPRPAARGDDREAHFAAFVLDDAQRTWAQEFLAHGQTYRRAKLVLFTDSAPTGCGYGDAAAGPFYCPADERVYIDLGFYRELEHDLGARGQFAQAYVIGHELGHHVQKLLGRTSGRAPGKGAEGGSVRLELQADCYAGLWAHSTAQRDLLEKGDVESALGAAAAIGDDKLQRRSGRVRPESFTHGTSEQRVRWFKRGYEQGTIEACDTFGAQAL